MAKYSTIISAIVLLIIMHLMVILPNFSQLYHPPLPGNLTPYSV